MIINAIFSFIEVKEDTKTYQYLNEIYFCMNMNNSSFEEFILKKCICILKIIQLYQTEEKLKTSRVNRNVRKDYRPLDIVKINELAHHIQHLSSMVLLSVFSLPIMNYKTLFLQKRYCSLLNQNALLVKYYFPGRGRKKKQKK